MGTMKVRFIITGSNESRVRRFAVGLGEAVNPGVIEMAAVPRVGESVSVPDGLPVTETLEVKTVIWTPFDAGDNGDVTVILRDRWG